jgi:glycosyltransferase involved in cell wall biosynthesis
VTNIVDLTVVLPCLNEAQTLPMCIDEINETLQKSELSYQILIADNGSDDGSIKIAEQSENCIVINVPERGYGSALKAGIMAADSEYVVFADADFTYPFNLLEEMYKTIIDKQCDMVIASRYKGTIEEGAMPFLHKYAGTPVLTKSINLLYHSSYSDCNSGYRLFKKSAYESWEMQSSGMEFASEMLIKAAKANCDVIEIPGGLRKDIREDRIPHLKTWRDGMRHLLYIFSQAPRFFEKSGILLFIFGFLFSFISSFDGILVFGKIGIFGLHTQIMLATLMLVGIELYTTAFVLFLKSSDVYYFRFTKLLLEIRDDYLFFSLLIIIALMIVSFILFVQYWLSHEMQMITLHTEVLFIASILASSYILVSNLLKFHLLKRSV